MSTQETTTPIPIRVQALSPCMVCLETFPKKTLIKDGTCDDGICKSCIKGITNGKCPNCREVYSWWSTPPNEDVIIDGQDIETMGSLQNELMDLQNELSIANDRIVELEDVHWEASPLAVPLTKTECHYTTYANKKGAVKHSLIFSDAIFKEIKAKTASLDATLINID